MNVGTSHFFLATTEIEEKEMFELQSKYESVLESYNKELKKENLA